MKFLTFLLTIIHFVALVSAVAVAVGGDTIGAIGTIEDIEGRGCEGGYVSLFPFGFLVLFMGRVLIFGVYFEYFICLEENVKKVRG